MTTALPPELDSLLHSHLLWYLNRGTGIVLVAVLTLSTVLGMLSASGRGSPRWPRFARQTLHRNVSLIACGLLVAHAAAPVIDTYVNHYAPIAWLDAVVPFTSAYKPLALGLGTLALDLVVVVVLSSVARRRFGHRAWFSLHLLSYAAWGLGLVHGFLIGSDSRTVWSLGVTAAAIALVLGALVVRLVPAPPAAAGTPWTAGAGGSVAAAESAVAQAGGRRRSRRERQRAADDAAYGPPYGQGYGRPYAGTSVQDPTYRQDPGYDQTYGQDPGYDRTSRQDSGYDQIYVQDLGYDQTYAQDPGYDQTYGQDPGYDQTYAQDPGYDQTYVQDPGYGRGDGDLSDGPDDGDDLRYDPLAAPAPDTRRGRRARRAQV